MDKNYIFLIENLDQLKELEKYELENLNTYLTNTKNEFLNNIKNDFDTKPNFEVRLKAWLNNIDTAINFIKKHPNSNEKTNCILKQYESTITLLKKGYKQYYPNMFLDRYRQSMFRNIIPNSPEEKLLNNVTNNLLRQKFTPGNEEYFNYNKLNEVFKDFNSYKIFFIYTELFKIDNKIQFSFNDASYLYRKMYEKKYIIETVSESDFRKSIYDNMKLFFEKLSTLSKTETIYRNIIFNLIERQNRPQKSFLCS